MESQDNETTLTTVDQILDFMQQHPEQTRRLIDNERIQAVLNGPSNLSTYTTPNEKKMFYQLRGNDHGSRCFLIDPDTGTLDIFTPTQTLGQGSFGSVRLFDNHKSDAEQKKIAVKSSFSHGRTNDWITDYTLDQSVAEWQFSTIAYEHQQPNRFPVACTLFAYQAPRAHRTRLIMPLIENSQTAYIFLAKIKQWTPLINAIRVITKSLLDLHTKGIVHGDVKADNILMTSNDANEIQSTFVDYGFSALCGDMTEKFELSEPERIKSYLAPERLIIKAWLLRVFVPPETISGRLLMQQLESRNSILIYLNTLYYLDFSKNTIIILPVNALTAQLKSIMPTTCIQQPVQGITADLFVRITNQPLSLTNEIAADPNQDVYSFAYFLQQSIKLPINTPSPLASQKISFLHHFITQGLSYDPRQRPSLAAFYDALVSESIQLAIIEQDLSTLERLLPENLHQLDQIHHSGYTYLHLACIRNHVRIVAYLLSLHANVMISMTFKKTIHQQNHRWLATPLDIAFKNQHHELVALLIAHGAVIMPATPGSFHNMHAAAAYNNIMSLQYMLNLHPEWLDITDTYQQTPLLWAVNNQHLDAVRFLIDQGANLHACTSMQDTSHPIHQATALDFAIMTKHADIILYLIEKGATCHHRHDLSVFEGPVLEALSSLDLGQTMTLS